MKREKILLLASVLLWAACSTDANDTEEQTGPDDMPMIARTAIPDANFEQALIDLDLDDEVDGFVNTNSIKDVEDLVIEDKGIASLSGIEDFTALVGLWVSRNDLTTLDLTENRNLKFAFVADNALTSLLVNQLTLLEKIQAENNALVSLNISDNQALQQLSLANNQLAAINISNITNTTQLNTFSIENNPLECIIVNQEQLNNIPSQWTKDAEDVYALDCN
ncbi:MAG: hypothetical protein KJP14_10415 [Eudoraea sp.]|nr:hypothetical protein [Eudoraea sp.]